MINLTLEVIAMIEATLAYIMRGGMVLLGLKMRGEFGTGILTGPGGKLHPGESPESCVVREVREEFGIELSVPNLRRAGMLISYRLCKPWFRVHLFCADAFAGEPWETDEMRPEWHPVGNLPFGRMAKPERHWLPKTLAGERLAVHIYYQGNGRDFDRIECRPLLIEAAP